MTNRITHQSKRHKLMLAVGAALVILPSIAVAEKGEKERKPVTVTCPPVIADRQEGVYYSTKGRKGSSRFECYDSRKEARKGGFTGIKSLSRGFTGWYRTSLNVVKDTCSAVPA